MGLALAEPVNCLVRCPTCFPRQTFEQLSAKYSAAREKTGCSNNIVRIKWFSCLLAVKNFQDDA